jgi:membrane protease YdiL (CAAX protease family)
MQNNALPQTGKPHKGLIFLVFFLLESAVFASITLLPYFQQKTLLSIHGALTAILLVIALVIRRSEKWKAYWPVCYTLFLAGLVVYLSTQYSDNLLGLFGLSVSTPEGIATAKFSQSIIRVVPILILMPLAGFDWGSMYLKRGVVRTWLSVAIAAIIIFPVIAYLPLANQPGTLDKLLGLWPWILLFVLSNGFMEELVYRGLFLKRFEPFLGKRGATVLTAVVFAIMHTQVTYAAQMVQFLVIVLVLSLIWGYLIQKTDSLWGAVLFHAAADCLVIFGPFASL